MESKTDKIVKIVTAIVAVSGLVFSAWQFSSSQKAIAISKFKEIQIEKYNEAAKIVGQVITTEDFKSEDFNKTLKKFKQLYWVELSAVEDTTVEYAMVRLNRKIEVFEARNFNEISRKEKRELNQLGLDVAHAIKYSSRDWSLPRNN